MVKATLLASLLLCPVLAVANCTLGPANGFLPKPFNLENLPLTSLRFDMQPSLLVYYNRTHGSCLRAYASYERKMLNVSIICGNQDEQTAKINATMEIYSSVVYVRHRSRMADNVELYFCDWEFQQQGWLTINTYPVFLEPEVTRSSLVLFGHSCREQCQYRMDLQVLFEGNPKEAAPPVTGTGKQGDKFVLFSVGIGTTLVLVLLLCIGCSFF